MQLNLPEIRWAPGMLLLKSLVTVPEGFPYSAWEELNANPFDTDTAEWVFMTSLRDNSVIEANTFTRWINENEHRKREVDEWGCLNTS